MEFVVMKAIVRSILFLLQGRVLSRSQEADEQVLKKWLAQETNRNT